MKYFFAIAIASVFTACSFAQPPIPPVPPPSISQEFSVLPNIDDSDFIDNQDQIEISVPYNPVVLDQVSYYGYDDPYFYGYDYDLIEYPYYYEY